LLQRPGQGIKQIIATRLEKVPGYVEEFKKVFGTKDGDPLTIDHVAKAIATYERTLVTHSQRPQHDL
jgi:cytochrome c peroxidase